MPIDEFEDLSATGVPIELWSRRLPGLCERIERAQAGLKPVQAAEACAASACAQACPLAQAHWKL